MPALPLPNSSSDISTEWLNKVLGDAGVSDGTAIHGFEREVIGEGSGFVGELSRLSLTKLELELVSVLTDELAL